MNKLSLKRQEVFLLFLHNFGVPVHCPAYGKEYGRGLGLYLHARSTEVAIESIAVLPFDNQTRDPNTEYLSHGVTESISNSLTQLPNLRVIARNSVFR